MLPDVAGFDREFDYLVPAGLTGSVRPGSLVRIPLQGRQVSGWVVSFPVEPPPGVALRPMTRITGWGPEPELFELASWAAWRWAGRRRSLLFTASAGGAVKQLPAPPPAAAPSVPAGPSVPTGPVGVLRPRGEGRREPGRDLLEDAWGPGTHVLRLPPAQGATGLVLAAAERGPALVVVPTTSRAEAGCSALRKQGAQVALLPGEWPRARAGAQVVIGARGAAWGPCPGIASVIVLDAHDEGLVQEQAPTWDAPAVAAERARRAGAPCFWVTPCPTVDLLNEASEIHITSRATERAGWAAVEVVDCRREDPRSGLYSRRLVEALRHTESRVVCVLNRKGRALLLDCGACGEVATCERCGAGAALAGEELTCRRCRVSRPVVCASCGSDALRLLRVGVSRAREQLEALAGRAVGEVPAGTGPLPEAPILVGTEAVLYREGELRRGVGAVAFLDFDQEMLAPRYRAGEEALALLARASRVVGGRERGGRVIVQTRLPAHPVIEAAALADPGRLSAAEEPVRQALRLPPFAALAVLSGAGAAELAAALSAGQPCTAEAKRPRGHGRECTAGRGLEVSELSEGRWVVRAPDRATLADTLARAGRPAGRVRVDVGPVRF